MVSKYHCTNIEGVSLPCNAISRTQTCQGAPVSSHDPMVNVCLYLIGRESLTTLYGLHKRPRRTDITPLLVRFTKVIFDRSGALKRHAMAALAYAHRKVTDLNGDTNASTDGGAFVSVSLLS